MGHLPRLSVTVLIGIFTWNSALVSFFGHFLFLIDLKSLVTTKQNHNCVIPDFQETIFSLCHYGLSYLTFRKSLKYIKYIGNAFKINKTVVATSPTFKKCVIAEHF